MGYRFGCHFEDDPIQAEEIKKIMPHINIVMLQHDLVEKENVRRDDWREEIA
jgi:CDP-glycerol glycerophosphotransferase (TagB/SpsB family)